MSDAVSKIKRFLEEWIEKGEAPDGILDIDSKNLSNQKIIRELGLYLQREYNDVKQPRVYQFIKYALNPVVDANLELLLHIISQKSRDTIEKIIDKESYRVELLSSIGLTRFENQDYLGYLELDGGILLIVADGVGGGESGEIASELVVNSIVKSFESRFDPDTSKEHIKGFLKESILKANRELLEFAKNNQKTTMATTLSMALILNGKELYIAHVGDSRIYELDKNDKVIQRTQDHSVREVLYRSNRITKEEKSNYKKNILAYVIGKNNLRAKNIFIEYSILYRDSKLLLCSDGFWELWDDEHGIDKNIFNMPLDMLKAEIYSKIPKDNVTVIRYFPKPSKNNGVCLECDESEKSISIKSKSSYGIGSHNNFSNRKTKSRVLKNKRVATIVFTLITLLVAYYYLA